MERFQFKARRLLRWIAACLASEFDQLNPFQSDRYICEGAVEFRQRLAERRLALELIEEHDLTGTLEGRLNQDFLDTLKQAQSAIDDPDVA